MPLFPQTNSDRMYPLDDSGFICGQRFMIGFDGVTLTPFLKKMIRDHFIGGVILFQRNIETPDQVRRLTSDIQYEAEKAGLPPLFIAVDQEGGTVARLRPPEFSSYARCPGGQADMTTQEEAAEFARTTARELHTLGFNMNMAPVLDVASGETNSIMASRTFPGGPEEVGRLGVHMIRAYQDNGIIAVAKHFPGIGRTRLDSHIDLPVMAAAAEDIRAHDLPPFSAAVAADVGGIMFSHILYPEIDPIFPASRSPVIAEDWLRRDMGFTGLSLTDDLDMGAVRRHADISTVIRETATAGLDLILICHESPDIETAMAELRRFLSLRPEEAHRFEGALSRILRAKKGLCRA